MFAFFFFLSGILAQNLVTRWTVGTVIPANEILFNSAQTAFALQQTDGNFCLYRGSGPGHNLGRVKCSNAHPGFGNDYTATMLDSGNFCTYQNGTALWCYQTTQVNAPNFSSQFYFAILDNGTDWYIGLDSAFRTVVKLNAFLARGQSVPSNCVTTAAFDTLLTNVSPQPFTLGTTFTIPVGGWYSMTFGLCWAAHAGGERSIWPNFSGSNSAFVTGVVTQNAVEMDRTCQSSSLQAQFAAGDTIGMNMWQTSGIHLTVAAYLQLFLL